jgi:hypothetical protein
MRIFKKHHPALTRRQEQFAGKISDKMLRCQRKTADYLNRRTAGMSRRLWLFLLFVFCLAFGSYCLYLFIRAFQ